MQIALATLLLATAASYLVWIVWRSLAPRHVRRKSARPRVSDGGEPSPPETLQTMRIIADRPGAQVIHMKPARVRPDRPVVVELPLQPKPLRSGWNEADDAELLRLVAGAVPTAEIAAKLGRSENSVLLRIPLLNLRHRQAGQMTDQMQAAGA
jgi:hypothetical protein